MATIRKTINIDKYRPVAARTPAPNGYYWDAAWAQLMADIKNGPLGYEDSGVTIEFNFEQYYFANNIVLNRGVNLRGTGPVGQRSGSILVCTNDQLPGITIMPTNDQSKSRGTFSVIEKLSITGTRDPLQDGNQAFEKNHGILMRGCAYIRDCHIKDFYGSGIFINASVKAENEDDYGNANHFQINNCYVSSCGKYGLHVNNGSDTSGGLIMSLFAGDNGDWEIYDDSFHGNTYIACSCYSSAGKGAYKTRGGTNTSVFINCYTEGNSSSEVRQPAFILGGNIWNIPALGTPPLNTNNFAVDAITPYLDSGIGGFSRFEGLPNEALVFAALGGLENTALSLRAALNPQLLQLGFKTTNISGGIQQNGLTEYSKLQIDQTGWWAMRTRDQSSFAFSSDQAAEGVGNFWLPNGFYIGIVPNRNKVISGNYDNYVLLQDPNQHRIGDIILNNYPVMGHAQHGFAGYICVKDADGLTNIWAGFGKIEPLP